MRMFLKKEAMKSEATELAREAKDFQRTGDSDPLAPTLSLRGVSKSFGGVRALKDVDFDAYASEVHVILGENGAGKSTLIKVLAGMHEPDTGEVRLQSGAVRLPTPLASQAQGIAVIHQELALVPHLSVADNIYLGREPRLLRTPFVDRNTLRRDAKQFLDAIGFAGDINAEVGTLSTAQQQLIEIAKALSQRARILIMDEPTASISDRECQHLYKIIAQLKAEGVAIIFISHRMREVFALADRITVMRDGHKVSTMLPQDATPDELIKLMVGRQVASVYKRARRELDTAPLLEVRGLSASSGIFGIDLTVRAGEIVGLAGLVGAGRTEVARAIFGADPQSAGTVHLFGTPFKGSPADAVRLGVGLIPESRKEQGLAVALPIVENIGIASLWKSFKRGVYSRAAASQLAVQVIERLAIKTPDARRQVMSLSGGNQQKVVIGKWLPIGCKLLIFDEPTRGIDVGAKAEIFRMMDSFVAEGNAVLMISSELPEIVGVCDRVYVMRARTLSGELKGELINEQEILKLAVTHD